MVWTRIRVTLTAISAGASLLSGCQAVQEQPDPSQPNHTSKLNTGHASPVTCYVDLSGKNSTPSPSQVIKAANTEPRVGLVRPEHRDTPTQVTKAASTESAGPPTATETLDLDVALRLAGIENPTINLARERIREALGQHLAARSLLLPNLNIGGNLRIQRGPLQDDPGELRYPNLQSLYLGAGTGAIGTNPAAIPGVRLFAHLGDAVYEPLAARQRVAVRRSDAQAVHNQILLDVSVAYLELIGAEARVDILRRAEKEVTEIARITAEFARTGQGTPSNANRAATNAELIRRQLRQVEGSVGVASARLCRLLNLDPSIQLRSPGGPVESIRLIPEDTDTEQLIADAMLARPELQAGMAAIREAQTRVRQEQVRPFLPTVSIGYSAGGMGGGSNLVSSPFSSLNGRSDFDAFAVWNVQNFGFGNRARVRAANATVGQTGAAYQAVLNQVRSEVTEAQANAKAGALQTEVVRSSLSAAEEGYTLERDRIKRGEGRPIESLDSFRQLVDARLEYLDAIVAFDVAQFRLFVALGSFPTSSTPQPTGGSVPLDKR